MRRAIAEAPHLMYDMYLRTRSEEELMRRCETLMKALKKERGEQSAKREAVKKELEKERATLLKELGNVLTESERLGKALEEARGEVAALQASLREAKTEQQKTAKLAQKQAKLAERQAERQAKLAERQAVLEQKRAERQAVLEQKQAEKLAQLEQKQKQKAEAKEMTLRGLQLPEEAVLKLVPLLEQLRRSVRGRLGDVHTYALRLLPDLPRAVVRDAVTLVTLKNTAKGTVGLRSELVDREKGCVDLSKEMEVSARVREECEKASKEPAGEMMDLRETNRKEEERLNGAWEKVLQRIIESGSIANSVLFSQATKEELKCDDRDLRALAKKHLQRKGAKWVLKPEKTSVKRPAEEADMESKKQNA